jgi:hypothetical protein
VCLCAYVLCLWLMSLLHFHFSHSHRLRKSIIVLLHYIISMKIGSYTRL